MIFSDWQTPSYLLPPTTGDRLAVGPDPRALRGGRGIRAREDVVCGTGRGGGDGVRESHEVTNGVKLDFSVK